MTLKRPGRPAWEENIAEEDWSVYEPVLKRAESSGIRFALGGAFALAAYTNHLRNTKDLDIYVLPSDMERMVGVVSQCGMEDYHPRASYDRSWIYRAYCESRIVDIIWAMPNRRSSVDEQWLTRGPLLEIRGFPLRVIPVEELFWAKTYVMQRDRCDWPDVLNLLYHSGLTIDWEHLLERCEDDFPLLGAILQIFRWLCPERAAKLPVSLWERVGREPEWVNCDARSHLLDMRPWFGEQFRHWPGK
jgi:hypothetical protein